MTLPGVSVLDAAFVLSTAAAGMIHPALCLVTGAAFFLLSFGLTYFAKPTEGK